MWRGDAPPTEPGTQCAAYGPKDGITLYCPAGTDRPRRAGHKNPVLRLTEIKLDLDHSEAALRNAILRALGIPEPELLGYRVRRRGYDARKSGEILFVYTLDAEVRDETALLEKFRHSHRIARAPDEKRTLHAPAEIARVRNGQIVVEPWNG